MLPAQAIYHSKMGLTKFTCIRKIYSFSLTQRNFYSQLSSNRLSSKEQLISSFRPQINCVQGFSGTSTNLTVSTILDYSRNHFLCLKIRS